jgi:hypothetical protein
MLVLMYFPWPQEATQLVAVGSGEQLTQPALNLPIGQDTQ